MSELPPEYLDSDTPPDVVVTDRARPRIEDPTLGQPLGPLGPDVPEPPAEPTHRLVTIGDSLTHGMSSGAVFRTDMSWPVIAARSLGIDDLAVPSHGGPLGGLPLNLEGLLRGLEDKFGDGLNPLELAALPIALQGLADSNEDYWERGPGSAPPPTDVRYENLGIYGWDIRDCLSYTAGRAAAQIGANPPRDEFFGTKPSSDNDIAALSVLAPFGVAAAQIDAVVWHGHDGGIDTLVIFHGSNNALPAVVKKRVAWSGADYADLDKKGKYTIWTPTHFAQEYAELVRAISPIPVRRVVLATVPHVTVAPIAKGVNPQNPGQKWRPGSRYFPYYTDPWIDEEDFQPAKHRHLTHQQVRAVDSAIDQFNDTIADAVRHARTEGRDWFLFDVCGILDGVALRRYAADADAAESNDWKPYPLPEPIADLDTCFFRSDRNGRSQGGLFSLDGVHPTTSGYGVIASALLDVLAAGGVPSTPVDFVEVRRQDTLNHNPPALTDAVCGLLAPFLTRFVSAPKREVDSADV
jgi:hypothetical protein